MPCPDFDVSIVQRSENMSAVNSSAYLSASKLFCEYDQEHKDYRYKQNELFHEEVMLPVNAPPEYADRQKLWNSVEAVETVRGKMILPSHGKEFFTRHGKQIFTYHGKDFFT